MLSRLITKDTRYTALFFLDKSGPCLNVKRHLYWFVFIYKSLLQQLPAYPSLLGWSVGLYETCWSLCTASLDACLLFCCTLNVYACIKLNQLDIKLYQTNNNFLFVLKIDMMRSTCITISHDMYLWQCQFSQPLSWVTGFKLDYIGADTIKSKLIKGVIWLHLTSITCLIGGNLPPIACYVPFDEPHNNYVYRVLTCFHSLYDSVTTFMFFPSLMESCDCGEQEVCRWHGFVICVCYREGDDSSTSFMLFSLSKISTSIRKRKHKQPKADQSLFLWSPQGIYTAAVTQTCR